MDKCNTCVFNYMELGGDLKSISSYAVLDDVAEMLQGFISYSMIN